MFSVGLISFMFTKWVQYTAVSISILLINALVNSFYYYSRQKKQREPKAPKPKKEPKMTVKQQRKVKSKAVVSSSSSDSSDASDDEAPKKKSRLVFRITCLCEFYSFKIDSLWKANYKLPFCQ